MSRFNRRRERTPEDRRRICELEEAAFKQRTGKDYVPGLGENPNLADTMEALKQLRAEQAPSRRKE